MDVRNAGPCLFFTPQRIEHLQELVREAEYQTYFGDLEDQVNQRPLRDEEDFFCGAAGHRAFDLALLDAALPGRGFGAQIPPILLRYSTLYPLQEQFGRGKRYTVKLGAPDLRAEEAEGRWHDNLVAAVEILTRCGALERGEQERLSAVFGQDPEYLGSVYVYTGMSPLWAEQALELAREFEETGRDRLAQKSVRLVEEYAVWMRHFTTGEWFGRPGGPWHDSPGILLPESLGEAELLTRLVLAYDLARPRLSAKQRDEFEDRVLRHAIETVFYDRDFHVPRNNHQWGHNAVIGLVGLCVGKERYVDYALNGAHGFFYHMREAVNRDGLNYEACFGYNLGCLGIYTPLAEAALGARGRDLYEHPRMRALLEGPPNYYFHDLGYAPVGDTGLATGFPCLLYPGFLAEAYGARYGKDSFTYAFYEALDRPQPRWTTLPEAFYRGERRFAEQGVTVEGCSLFEDTGCGVLRAPKSGVSACLSWLHNNVGHSHADGLSLVVHWEGTPVLPDSEQPHRYLDQQCQAWAKQTLAHNTVVVNQTSQEPRGYFKSNWIQEERPSVQGKVCTFAVREGRRLVRVEADKLYPGWVLTRSVCLTDAHLVDVFEVEGPESGWIDYVLHVNGKLMRASGAFERYSGALGDDAGYELLRDVQVFRERGRLVETVWEVGAGRFVSVCTRTEGADTEAFWGMGPYREGPGLPFLLVRVRGCRAAFASMVVPFTGEETAGAGRWRGEGLDREAAAVLEACARP